MTLIQLVILYNIMLSLTIAQNNSTHIIALTKLTNKAITLLFILTRQGRTNRFTEYSNLL